MSGRKVEAGSLDELRRIFEPDVHVVTYRYPVPGAVFNFLAAAKPQDICASELDRHFKRDDGKYVVHCLSHACSGAAVNLGQTAFGILPALDAHAGRPDFENWLGELAGNLKRTLRPSSLDCWSHLQRPASVQDEMHVDGVWGGVRALFTAVGNKGTEVELVPGQVETLPSLLLSLHKFREFRPVAALRHRTPAVNTPEECRGLLAFDLRDGECSRIPAARFCSRLYNKIKRGPV